ncbi:MAG: hypothetical protein RLZZ522_412 [Verrucomicrobiota bacterium]
MTLGTGFGSPTTTTIGEFRITSGENSRIYLGTNDTDYSTIDFTFDNISVSSPIPESSVALLGGLGVLGLLRRRRI